MVYNFKMVHIFSRYFYGLKICSMEEYDFFYILQYIIKSEDFSNNDIYIAQFF